MNPKPEFSDLVKVLREVFNQFSVPITATSVAADIPGWDSLSHVVLMMELEQQFGAEITSEEAADLPDVGALHRLVLERAR